MFKLQDLWSYFTLILARVQSLGGKKYILVVVDDFTRYTWVVLLKDKAEAPEKMIHLCKEMEENLRIPS